MNINWKVRFRNRVWLAGFIAAIVSFVFVLLEMFEVVPGVSENAIMNGVHALLTILTAMGVLVDPTTKGVGDSERALEYEEPN